MDRPFSSRMFISQSALSVPRGEATNPHRMPALFFFSSHLFIQQQGPLDGIAPPRGSFNTSHARSLPMAVNTEGICFGVGAGAQTKNPWEAVGNVKHQSGTSPSYGQTVNNASVFCKLSRALMWVRKPVPSSAEQHNGP